MDKLEPAQFSINIFDITSIFLSKLKLITLILLFTLIAVVLYTRTIEVTFNEKIYLKPEVFTVELFYNNFNVLVEDNELNFEKIDRYIIFENFINLLNTKSIIIEQLKSSNIISREEFYDQDSFSRELIRYANKNFKFITETNDNEIIKYYIEINGPLNQRQNTKDIVYKSVNIAEDEIRKIYVSKFNNFISALEASNINLIEDYKSIIKRKKDSHRKQLEIKKAFLIEQRIIAELLEYPDQQFNLNRTADVVVDLSSEKYPYYLKGYKLINKEIEFIDNKIKNIETMLFEDLIELESELLKIENDPVTNRLKSVFNSTPLIVNNTNRIFSAGRITGDTEFELIDNRRRIVISSLLFVFSMSSFIIIFVEFFNRYLRQSRIEV